MRCGRLQIRRHHHDDHCSIIVLDLWLTESCPDPSEQYHLIGLDRRELVAGLAALT